MPTYTSTDKYGDSSDFESQDEFCDAVEACGFDRPNLRPGTMNGQDVWLDDDDDIALVESQ